MNVYHGVQKHSPVSSCDVGLSLHSWGSLCVHGDASVGIEAVSEDTVALVHVLAANYLRVPESLLYLWESHSHGHQAGKDDLAKAQFGLGYGHPRIG